MPPAPVGRRRTSGSLTSSGTTGVPARRMRATDAGPQANNFPVVIGAGSHPFPFRTRKLSLLPPMVLRGKLRGRVGRCRDYSQGPVVEKRRALSFSTPEVTLARADSEAARSRDLHTDGVPASARNSGRPVAQQVRRAKPIDRSLGALGRSFDVPHCRRRRTRRPRSTSRDPPERPRRFACVRGRHLARTSTRAGIPRRGHAAKKSSLEMIALRRRALRGVFRPLRDKPSSLDPTLA